MTDERAATLLASTWQIQGPAVGKQHAPLLPIPWPPEPSAAEKSAEYPMGAREPAILLLLKALSFQHVSMSVFAALPS